MCYICVHLCTGGNDVPVLKDMFKRLGFSEPKVLSIKSSNKTPEARKKDFLTQISDIGWYSSNVCNII